MFRLKSVFIAIVISFVGLSASAQRMTAQQKQQTIAAITRAAKKIRTLQADFSQVNRNSFFSEEKTSEGKMYFKSPSLLRWEITDPVSNTLIVNKKQVISRIGKHTSRLDISENRAMQNMMQLIVSSLSGQNLTSNSDFNISMTAAKGQWIATLSPKRKDMKQMFKSIILTFNNKTRLVTQVKMNQTSGDNIIINFRNIKTNKSLSNNLFK